MLKAVVAVGLLLLASSAAAATNTTRPVVLLHGLMSTAEGMSHIEGWLKADYPGIYVHNLVMEDGIKIASLLIDMNEQLQIMHRAIKADPKLKDGFDLVGHSQGGLLGRVYMNVINDPPVHNFVSLAGPQAGVFGVPDLNDWCPDSTCPWIAKIMNDLAEGHATEHFFQKYITFAQYWKNPLDYQKYLKTSSFLAIVNNEVAVKNASYKVNMLKTTGTMVLVQAEDDHIVVPKQSTWFEFFVEGQDKVLYNMTESPGYKGDWIGLKSLDQNGQLALKKVPCTHQNLCRAACKSVVYDPIIKPMTGGSM